MIGSSSCEHDDVATLSHDLKNPLSMIALDVGVLQALLGESASRELHRALARIEHNVAFATKLIHDLLDLAAIGIAPLPGPTAPTELAALIVEVVDHMTARDERGRVRVRSAAPVVVMGDAARLRRVIGNLLQNALKFSAAEVEIHLDARGDRARVSVVDHGPGIFEADRAAIFEKFRRTREANGHDGMGLGLYVSRQIVEAHGGQIGVDSTPGEGARFFFELPRV